MLQNGSQSFVTSRLRTMGRRREDSAASVEQRTFREGLESATQHTWLHHFGQNLFPRPCQTAKEAWKWDDSSISCKVDDTLRRARIHCHRFCILRNWFFLFPVEWLLVRNPQTIPGIFRSQNFIDGIGSTGERRVDYSKCKSEATWNIARGGILASLEQEEQEEAELNGQGCLAERGTPVGSPGEDAATVQDATGSKIIEEERYWPFPFSAPHLPLVPHIGWNYLEARGQGSLENVVLCKQSSQIE